MKKKVLIVSSSPRKNGNSEMLCAQFAQGALEAGHGVERIALRDKTIHYCTGCGVCFDQGKGCPQRDDMADILEQMIAADVLVLATPVYFYTMAAQMKTLIDRTCSRYREITDKEFYFLIAAADTSLPAMERTIEGFRGFTSCLTGAKEMGIALGVGAWHPGEIQGTPAMRESFQLGKSL